MKYSEAEKQIKALSSKYSTEIEDFSGYFNVNYKGVEIAYVNYNKIYGVGVLNPKWFSTMPFSNKLYMILSELAMTSLDERKENKKYYVKVFNNGFGYLNINISDDNVVADTKPETDHIKTKFTSKAIEQLKQREDIPLDWNKVILEEVE